MLNTSLLWLHNYYRLDCF